MQLAVIPARGGSKRIPRKNIKDFYGKPMIAWSIEAALKSECFDEVWVSTDDEEIADIARQYGAKIPFMRPAHLSDDFATTADVMQHATHAFAQLQGQRPDYVCCLYATAPFVQTDDLKTGLKLLQNHPLDYAFSATTFAFPIQRAIKLNQDGNVEMFQPENFNKRFQDLEEAWHDAGQFYWGTAQAWLDKSVIFSNRSRIVELSRTRVQDIDTPDDWHRAELMAQLLLDV
ncbi:pseudaminic acid cytidylyltransferase [Acinetobacter gyllenbergii]|uniref:Pseudaminic acid CMP-transferase n=1 Tax=Acinetobacter gyllenbergii CIP 110306 = MTCC 11365 TaxID=1217657 RepID=A0A829HDY1_9GAMM|nr:pseudaminic acid cytidylyltransferase [Acinetobacter gyllenbergii]EPF74831.1 pseudaminic acid CMP-transferase [Acinetobacter gyllenbergii CIP 110306 = MTCC 11365]EPH31735.1 N-Acetylneuraminate cytidylyltransferase [Acinetobacter gyllenbergii CIP 110306 = MTCC 11365]GMA09620.1 pseudaminic acid cytidylyltransferase [Acinetobacter gyllenbergii]